MFANCFHPLQLNTQNIKDLFAYFFERGQNALELSYSTTYSTMLIILCQQMSNILYISYSYFGCYYSVTENNFLQVIGANWWHMPYYIIVVINDAKYIKYYYTYNITICLCYNRKCSHVLIITISLYMCVYVQAIYACLCVHLFVEVYMC